MTERENNVVEMDAIDGAEWDRDRHTPRAPETNLAALVKQTASVEALPPSKRAGSEPLPAKPRTTTATTKRLGTDAKPISRPMAVVVPRTMTPKPMPAVVVPPRRVTPPPMPVVARPPVPPPVLVEEVDDAWEESPKERVPVAAVISAEPATAPIVVPMAPMPMPPVVAQPPQPPHVVELPLPAPPPELIAPIIPTFDARDSVPALATMPARDTLPAMPEAREEPRIDLAPLQSRRTRRALVIGALSLATLVAVFAIASLAGSTADPVAASEPASPPAQPPAPPKPPAPPPAPAPAVVAAATPVDDTKPAPPPATVAHPPARRRAAAKPVVLDYDKTPPAPPAAHPDDALARARAAYTLGNRHLFAGETSAAITAYRQALAAYPNYAAGYRGLGLAYSQAGQRADALAAFKTYVALVPKAKDIALIQKRVAALSRK